MASSINNRPCGRRLPPLPRCPNSKSHTHAHIRIRIHRQAAQANNHRCIARLPEFASSSRCTEPGGEAKSTGKPLALPEQSRPRRRRRTSNRLRRQLHLGEFVRRASSTPSLPVKSSAKPATPQTDRAAMVSDSELVERLREVLRSSDLNTTTTAALRRHLEEDFGTDLSDKKAFIREQVDLFLTEVAAKAEPEEPKEEEAEEAAVPKEEEPEQEEKTEEGEGEEEDEGEEEEDEDEDGDSGGSRKKRRSDKANNNGKKRGGGFTKLCSLSPVLQEFVGTSELARTEVVKKLWAYIRENNLQDPSNKRKILCDERLKKIFNVNSIDMFQMNKALTKHIWPLNSEGPVSSDISTPKEKPQKRDRNEGKKQKGGSSGSASGFRMPLQLSDDLVKFIGTGESMLSRADVVKRMWDYIKENDLQDPSDRRKVICDEKLKDLLQVESFTGFTVSKLLAPHFTKTN
ncbi:hypothetical protein EJB05_04321, partial [Eragrostis curvula]